MRAAYGEITATVVGDLKLRSVALIASADRVR